MEQIYIIRFYSSPQDKGTRWGYDIRRSAEGLRQEIAAVPKVFGISLRGFMQLAWHLSLPFRLRLKPWSTSALPEAGKRLQIECTQAKACGYCNCLSSSLEPFTLESLEPCEKWHLFCRIF
ncbi:MAG: hypothetical protein A2Y81_12965 [Nitrospirae bacterium RBG_13_43_8]|nr:MAG: hypothetical protein A2Y81_12965 [Nitrospirae bacterium RBG_13_43_8]